MSDTTPSKPPAPGVPAPGPEHQFLLKKVGEWEVDCSYFMSGDDAVEAKGADRVEAVGGYWTVGHFEVELYGKQISGRAVTGYDPEKMAYIGSWHDSATPFFYYFEGQYDEIEKTLRMEGDNTDPMTGNLVTYRSVEEFVDDDTRRFTLSVETTPGVETPILRYEYRRK